MTRAKQLSLPHQTGKRKIWTSREEKICPACGQVINVGGDIKPTKLGWVHAGCSKVAAIRAKELEAYMEKKPWWW